MLYLHRRRTEVEEPPSRKQAVSSRRKKSRSQAPRMEVIQINLNHCRAAQDLLLQSVRVCKADLAVISEPYKVKDDGDWITDTSGKAAIWLCKRNGKSFLSLGNKLTTLYTKERVQADMGTSVLIRGRVVLVRHPA